MVTLLDFFSGLFPFPVDDSFIFSTCLLRQHDAELDTVADLTSDEIGLIRADLLKGFALSVCSWQNKTASTAFTSDQKSDAITPVMRRSMLIEANTLYFTHGEPESAYKLNAINVWDDEKGC